MNVPVLILAALPRQCQTRETINYLSPHKKVYAFACAMHETDYLANILRLRHFASHRSKVAVQGATKELQKHLETDSSKGGIVTAPRVSLARESFGG